MNITIKQFKAKFCELCRRAKSGEDIFTFKRGKLSLQLIPVVAKKVSRRELFAKFQGKAVIKCDLTKPTTCEWSDV